MKKTDIAVGSEYLAKVSGKMVLVKVDEIKDEVVGVRQSYLGKSVRRQATRYYVTNLSTGRKLVFRSASKFRTSLNKMRGTNGQDYS